MGINEPSQVLCLGIGNCWRLIKVGHWENRVIFWPQRSMVPFRWRATCQEIQKSKWAWMMTLALGMLALAAMVSTLLLIDWWNRSDCGNVTWLGADKLYNYHMRYFSKNMCGIVYVNVSRFQRSLLWSIRRKDPFAEGLLSWSYCTAPEYGAGGGVGMVLLDDCNFHESVRLDDFELDRTLTLVSIHPKK